MIDLVDHELLLNKLRKVGFSSNTAKWFRNDFLDRVYAEGHKSDFVEITKGIPQGFSVFINDLGKDIQANTHFYTSCCISSLQATLLNLKLVSNTQRTKLMVLSKDYSQLLNDVRILMTDDKSI